MWRWTVGFTHSCRGLLAFVLLAVSLVAGRAEAADEWVVRQSRHDVVETTRRLEDAVVRSGSVVLAVIDHQDAARQVGEIIAPTTVVIFAKPKLSTPLMKENRQLAIDLPQRILIWDDGGSTRIGYVSPFSLAERYGMNGDRREWEEMRVSLEALVQAAAARGERRREAGQP